MGFPNNVIRLTYYYSALVVHEPGAGHISAGGQHLLARCQLDSHHVLTLYWYTNIHIRWLTAQSLTDESYIYTYIYHLTHGSVSVQCRGTQEALQRPKTKSNDQWITRDTPARLCKLLFQHYLVVWWARHLLQFLHQSSPQRPRAGCYVHIITASNVVSSCKVCKG